MRAGQSRALKTRITSYFPNNSEPKKWLIGLALEPGKVGQKRENISHCDFTPGKSQTLNEKYFFQSQLENLLNP